MLIAFTLPYDWQARRPPLCHSSTAPHNTQTHHERDLLLLLLVDLDAAAVGRPAACGSADNPPTPLGRLEHASDELLKAPQPVFSVVLNHAPANLRAAARAAILLVDFGVEVGVEGCGLFDVENVWL